MTDQFESEADVGAYDEFIPKKYRKNEDMNYLPPDILKKRMKQVKKKTFSKFKEDIANTASGGNIAGLGSPPDDFPPRVRRQEKDINQTTRCHRGTKIESKDGSSRGKRRRRFRK